MSIRVGRRKYNRDGSFVDPTYEGYKNILVLTKSTAYGELGPYELKNDKGQIMENIWQFSKVYAKVPSVKTYYSRYNKLLTWEYPEETHVVNDKILPQYWVWREKGMNNKYYVRYPVGYGNMSTCLYALEGKDETKKLDYISARKVIYGPVYIDLARKQPKYQKLLNMLKSGKNILIIEVDGPHQEDLQYYMEKYNVAPDFINSDTMLATMENLRIMLNDPKYPYGHGYCLTSALLADLGTLSLTDLHA